MSRNRQSSALRDVASEVEDGWIWGSSRGGGGAPLKDSQGKQLTNLKLVLAGDVEPDHSPSKIKNGFDYDDDLPPRGPPRRRGYDDEDEDYRRRGQGGRGGRASSYRDDDYDDDYEYGRGSRRRSSGDGRGDGRRFDKYEVEEDYGRRRGRGHRTRDSPSETDISDSPKKHMSALREMITSEDPIERQAKIKKELTYQEELQKQIDEKKHKKDMEEHKEAMLKQKELEEYLSVHYQGNIPPHVTKKIRLQKQKLQEKEYELKRYEEGEARSSPSHGSKTSSFGRDNFGGSDSRRGRGADPYDRGDLEMPGRMPVRGGRGMRRQPSPDPDEDFDEPPRRADHRGGGGHQRAGFRREAGEEDLYASPPAAPRVRRGGGPGTRALRFEDEDGAGPKTSRSPVDDDYDDPPYRDSPARRGGRPPSGSDKWVPQAEYDELSALCDNLLKQQEDMQNELSKASTIKGRGGKAGPVVRGVGPNGARAKSQQQLHRERPKQGGAPAFGSSRPRSIQANERPGPAATSSRTGSARSRGGHTKPAGAPKVAFGRAIAATKSKVPDETPGQLDARQRKLVKAGGASMGRVMMKANERETRQPLSARSSGGSPPKAPRGGYEESPRGFHKLAAKARAGPVVVTYDDDLGGTTNRGNRNNGRTSVELNGESEYLKIGGEEVDLISGDQLDRLLSKARSARASE